MCPIQTVCLPIQVSPDQATTVSAISAKDEESFIEGDTHTDTTCIGDGSLELYDHLCHVNVQSYDPALRSAEHRTIGVALAFGHPFTGRRYHMI